MKPRRAYEEVRTMVEEKGGRMEYQQEGFPPGGAWIITYKGKRKEFPSGGRKFPGIDELYVPKIANPRIWDHYTHTLVNGAWEKLLRRLEE